MLNTLLRCESISVIDYSSSRPVMWTDILNCYPRAVSPIKAKSYHRLVLTATTSKLPCSDTPCNFPYPHAARCDNAMKASGLEKICVQSSIRTNTARAEAILSHQVHTHPRSPQGRTWHRTKGEGPCVTPIPAQRMFTACLSHSELRKK
jgi:hypothetical protein